MVIKTEPKMEAYRVHLPDPENGLSVPILVDIIGEDFFDAVKRSQSVLTEADIRSREDSYLQEKNNTGGNLDQ